VGLLAALFAIILTWLQYGRFEREHAILLCTSSVLTAALASFILGECEQRGRGGGQRGGGLVGVRGG